ncbi:MAG: thioesterase family protein [Antricoccus sp.]
MAEKSYRFDQAVTMTDIDFDAGSARCALDDGWNFNGQFFNGGYLHSVTTNAARVLTGSRHPDPVAVNSTFVRGAESGTIDLTVEILSEGGSVTNTTVVASQHGKTIVASIITLVDLSAAAAPADSPVAPPKHPMLDVPGPLECHAFSQQRKAPLGDIIEMNFVPEFSSWATGDFSVDPRITFWVRFVDGRPLDTLSLGGLSDMGPPVAFAQGRFGWAPTLQLHTAAFAAPEGQWLLVDMQGSPYDGKFICEDVEMWDERGVLVGRARQEAIAPRPRDSTSGTAKSGH